MLIYLSQQFTFCYDLDGNGIVDALGTENITATASSIAKGTAEKFLEKGDVFCWTQNEPYSWLALHISKAYWIHRFCVDFGEQRSIVPSHYTLRYGSSGLSVLFLS